jgi:hypothetical protein
MPMQSQQLPLYADPQNRDDTTLRDARLLNGYWEKDLEGKFIVNKRPGMLNYSTILAGANGYGLYNWQDNVYAVVGTALYKDGVSVGTVDTTNGVYSFSAILGATPKLFLMNGVAAYTYDTVNGLVRVTNINYPASLVKGAVNLDGTMYVMDSFANIWGSSINDAQTWSASNYITAQIEADRGIGLAKQMSYVVALKQTTVELFYDAANASGSPLGTLQGAKINVGCRHQGSIQDIDGHLIWVAQNKSGSVGVWEMDNAQAKPIETPAVTRLLHDADYTTVYSWQAKISGNMFYVVTIKNSNLTLAYNLTSGLWSQWTDTNGNYVPIVASCRDATQKVLLQHETEGELYYFSNMYYNDDGAAITFDLYTPNYNGGTNSRKIVGTTHFDADQTNGSMLNVRHSSDDYQTWSDFRDVDLSMKKPKLTNCGTFVKRAYHLRHKANTPFRLRSVELSMELGTV